MNQEQSAVLCPDIIKRARGGFLAISNRGLAVRIGATGDTEEEARAAFDELVSAWVRDRQAERVSREGARSTAA